MPPLDERLRLAERTMVALVADAELPPKIGVHPRPEGSFAHAMPAHLRGADPAAPGDLLGIKWIAGFPANRERGLPAIHGLVLLTDPATGVPTAILDAGPITAQRTAAISGVAIAPVRRGHRAGRRASRSSAPASRRAATCPSSARCCPACEIVVFDRHADRSEARRRAGTRRPTGSPRARIAASAREATRDADVVVTVASFAAAAERQVLTPDWLTPDALVVAVDYATYVSAAVAREATLFAVDERAQFLANRDAGQFRRLPGPVDDDRRGDRRGHRAAGAGPGPRHASGRRPGGSRVRRGDRPPRDGAGARHRPAPLSLRREEVRRNRARTTVGEQAHCPRLGDDSPAA